MACCGGLWGTLMSPLGWLVDSYRGAPSWQTCPSPGPGRERSDMTQGQERTLRAVQIGSDPVANKTTHSRNGDKLERQLDRMHFTHQMTEAHQPLLGGLSTVLAGCVPADRGWLLRSAPCRRQTARVQLLLFQRTGVGCSGPHQAADASRGSTGKQRPDMSQVQERTL